jgi:excisionase family DNA binding protein
MLAYARQIKARAIVETNHQHSSEEPVLLRVHPDLTQLTRLSRTTLYAEISAGRLRAIHVGRAIRVRREDLEVWIRRHAGDDTVHDALGVDPTDRVAP